MAVTIFHLDSHEAEGFAQGYKFTFGKTAKLGGADAVGVSATTPALASSGTITTAGTGVARVTPAAAVTGVILEAGTVDGQRVTVVNNGLAASTVTFAAAGTSNVADGTSSVIAGLAARSFVWDATAARWFPCK